MLKVLYHKPGPDGWIAVEKPSGLLVHPSLLAKREEETALKLLRDQLGSWVYPVHRLDRPTSGVLIFALSHDRASELAQKFQNEEVEKTYYAVVRGWLPSGPQLFDQELRKVSRAKKYDGDYQRAVTQYERIESFELPFSTHPDHQTSRYSLVRARPKTGRWHQIRRHFAMASHPLIGDTVYGAGVHNRLFREKLDVHRLLLHCAEMSFLDGKEQVVVVSELPHEFRSLLREYRVESP
jgi:tRNA pseudouridine65 synthase